MTDQALAQEPANRTGFDDDLYDIMQPKEGRVVIVVLGVAILFFLLWAGLTKLDEVTRSEGRVIPSSNTQTVDTSTAGTVSELLVRVGQSVEAGQVLVRLDDTLSSSDLGQLESQWYALRAQKVRLEIQYNGGSPEDFVCPTDVLEQAPETCANERQLTEARLTALHDRQESASQQVTQRERQLAEANARIATYEEGVSLASRQRNLIRPMVEDSVLPQTDLLEAERAFSEQRGLLVAAREAAESARAAVAEAEAELRGILSSFREESLTQLQEVNGELDVIGETLRGATDRVQRAEIRSPVSGTVNSIAITTLGTYVAPGDTLLTIVPRDDALVIEARVQPSDIAFIRRGQQASVKITAYDFAIYGGLDAEVTYVSSDSVFDPERDETYFVVHLEGDQAYLESRGEQLPISPGMVAQAEIITGRKSVLDYLLKPVTRAWGRALHER
jgi:adhesin transport system membrane fusion protein